MSTQPTSQRSRTSYISTGHLPPHDQVRNLVTEAYEHRVPNDLFGICVVGTSGTLYAAGDAEQ